MKTMNNENNATINYTCAIYSMGMLIGHVEMTNKEIVRFNADNRGELYAKALLNNRKEVKTA